MYIKFLYITYDIIVNMLCMRSAHTYINMDMCDYVYVDVITAWGAQFDFQRHHFSFLPFAVSKVFER